MKRIIISSDDRAFLCKLFSVTPQYLWRVVNYKIDSELARRIRKAAIERGCEVVGGPKMETIYKEGKMIQTFGSRVRIEVDYQSRVVLTYVDNRQQDRYEGRMSIPDFVKIQNKMKRIADNL